MYLDEVLLGDKNSRGALHVHRVQYSVWDSMHIDAVRIKMTLNVLSGSCQQTVSGLDLGSTRSIRPC